MSARLLRRPRHESETARFALIRIAHPIQPVVTALAIAPGEPAVVFTSCLKAMR